MYRALAPNMYIAVVYCRLMSGKKNGSSFSKTEVENGGA